MKHRNVVKFKPRLKIEVSPVVKLITQERAKVNRLNRQRARAMEQDVAKFLGGLRVPMSGAGYLKGDVLARTYTGDLVLIECKISAREGKYGPLFFMDVRYFENMIKSAASMGAAYAALVFRYLGSSTLYFCMLLDNFELLGYNINMLPYVELGKSRYVLHKVLLDNLPKPFYTKFGFYDVVIIDQYLFLALLEGRYGE